MFEAQCDEVDRSLRPVRVESDQAGLGGELQDPRLAVGRLVANDREHLQAQAAETGVYREPWTRVGVPRAEPRLQVDIKHRLAPDELRRRRQGLGADVCQRAVEVGEGSVGRDRDADGLNRRRRQLLAAGVQIEVGRDPAVGGFHEQAAGAQRLEVQNAPMVDRELHLLHRLERRSHQHLEPFLLRSDQHLDRDAARRLVGRGGPGAGQERGHADEGGERDESESGSDAKAVQGVDASASAARHSPPVP